MNATEQLDSWWSYSEYYCLLLYEARGRRFQVQLGGYGDHATEVQILVAGVAALELERIRTHGSAGWLERCHRASAAGAASFALGVAARRVEWECERRYGLRPTHPVSVTAV